MIEVNGLTKQYGRLRAVDDLSFRVVPGQVTGFLGPNGSGKSSTMRMILGMDRLLADHGDEVCAAVGDADALHLADVAVVEIRIAR